MDSIKGIRLTDDALTNLHIMVPLLDQNKREIAFAYILGLITGEGAACSKEDIQDKQS